MTIQLRSFSLPAVSYEVDKNQGRCSCSSYASDGWCKHLEQVGRYKQRNVTLSSRPSYSQALSGVVKGIRVRNLIEAAYWLNYCWTFNNRLSGSQFRTVRRLLIGAAEDGHSIVVMERVADAFIPLLAKDAQLVDVLAQLIRICKVPNWWQPETGGHEYIYAGMLAQRRMLYDHDVRSTAQCLDSLEKSINDADQVSALFWTMKAHESGTKVGLLLAEKLLHISRYRDHDPARRLIENIYMPHAKSLTADTNFTCQSAWLLAGGSSPIVDQIEPVLRAEGQRLLDEVLAAPVHIIPGYMCDGIHCAGNDVRYAGMWDRMFAVCQQFKHYQRVDPDDVWLENEFYSMDGLMLGKAD
jgi:hypothetical protein